MNFVNYASANRREHLNPPEWLTIRSERLIAKQNAGKHHQRFEMYNIPEKLVSPRRVISPGNHRSATIAYSFAAKRGARLPLTRNDTVKELTNARRSGVVNVATSLEWPVFFQFHSC